MDKNNIGAKCEQLYLMSKKRLEEDDDPDLADEVICSMWNAVESLSKEKKSLQDLCYQQAKGLAEYHHKQDILESRIAILSNEKNLNGIS